MQNYKFELTPFENMHFTEEETEARLKACLEDATNDFQEANVGLEGNVLCISVESKDILSEEDCLKRFKEILVNGSLYLFARQI